MDGQNDIKLGEMITVAYRPDTTSETMDVACQVLEVNDEEMCVSWRGCLPWVPTMMLLPEKVQRVTMVSETHCLYEIYETQSGLLAYVIKWTMGEKLSGMQRAMAENLKEYVEQGQG